MKEAVPANLPWRLHPSAEAHCFGLYSFIDCSVNIGLNLPSVITFAVHQCRLFPGDDLLASQAQRVGVFIIYIFNKPNYPSILVITLRIRYIFLTFPPF